MGEGFDAQAVRFFSEADRIANIDDAAVFAMVVERTEVLEIGMLMQRIQLRFNGSRNQLFTDSLPRNVPFSLDAGRRIAVHPGSVID